MSVYMIVTGSSFRVWQGVLAPGTSDRILNGKNDKNVKIKLNHFLKYAM